MLKECFEVFKKKLDENGDKFILDFYILVDGIYILVEFKNNFYGIREVIDIKLNKKIKEIN